MDSSCIDCKQPLHHIKMSSHPEILSIRDAFLKAEVGVNIPESIIDPNTKKEIAGTVTVTLKDVDEANDVVAAVRGHFASSPYGPEIKHQVELITKMYYLAVEKTYCNATFFRDATPVDSQNEIQDLKNKIRDLERKIGPSRDSVVEKIDSVQITAENAQIAHRNSRCGYTEEFRALRKVRVASGFELAQAVCPEHVNENSFKDTTTEPPEVGSTPLGFDGQVAMYSDVVILKMIVFYNNHFGITKPDVLSVRINKFQSFLSGYLDM
ncbi:hypothetical protein EV421DRAFT_1914999 [Armillaria borealis]|uniref:Uncharacterized protein n=1 Tax=Armillaria borealis TaxID=47425 RepID=A0AA39IF02_9AGAR|nr:hypothetical protein EV421DRAFT_1914999 [Armillaria borealis]